MTSISLDDQFILVENAHEELGAVKLTRGKYEGLVYQYGKVQFVDNKPELNFERTIRVVPEGVTKEEAEQDGDLSNLMGDILVHLIEKQINENEKS